MKAYPFQHKNPTSGLVSESQGMDLRDYFAAKAMQALIHVQVKTSQVHTVETAYEWADAMLKVREVKHDNN